MQIYLVCFSVFFVPDFVRSCDFVSRMRIGGVEIVDNTSLSSTTYYNVIVTSSQHKMLPIFLTNCSDFTNFYSLLLSNNKSDQKHRDCINL